MPLRYLLFLNQRHADLAAIRTLGYIRSVKNTAEVRLHRKSV
jgi:hypothetical protein